MAFSTAALEKYIFFKKASFRYSNDSKNVCVKRFKQHCFLRKVGWKETFRQGEKYCYGWMDKLLMEKKEKETIMELDVAWSQNVLCPSTFPYVSDKRNATSAQYIQRRLLRLKLPVERGNQIV